MNDGLVKACNDAIDICERHANMDDIDIPQETADIMLRLGICLALRLRTYQANPNSVLEDTLRDFAFIVTNKLGMELPTNNEA